MTTLWIVLAGAFGCVCRWGIEEVVERRVLSHRPYATMGVNALGSLLAGFVVFGGIHLATRHGGFSHDLLSFQTYLVTGFCGGFTTFSSALAIPLIDWHRHRHLRAVVLIGLTPVLCIGGYALGELLARTVFASAL